LRRTRSWDDLQKVTNAERSFRRKSPGASGEKSGGDGLLMADEREKAETFGDRLS